MKTHLLIIISAFFVINAYGQDYYNSKQNSKHDFKTINNSLVYQKVHDFELTQDVLNFLKIKGARINEATDSTILFDFYNYKVDYKRQGLRDMTAPIFFSSNLFFTSKIEKRENRYRVTVFSIKYKDSFSIDLGEVELPADINTIEELVLNRKGEIRTNTLTILNVLSADFDYLFSAPGQSIEEW